MKRLKTLTLFVLLIAATVLQILPFGAVLRFADPDSGETVQTFSYFDLTPFGYANFGPFLTALLTLALLVLLTVFCVTKKRLSALRIVSVAAVLMSILPVVMFGWGYATVLGGCITVLLAAESILLFCRTA